jgi:hypothetical protein
MRAVAAAVLLTEALLEAAGRAAAARGVQARVMARQAQLILVVVAAALVRTLAVVARAEAVDLA